MRSDESLRHPLLGGNRIAGPGATWPPEEFALQHWRLPPIGFANQLSMSLAVHS